MKSRFSIEMDFRRAKQQADELDSLAKELKTVASNDYENTINQINANWESDCSKEYINKAYTVKERMEKSAASLSKAADTIRQIAQNIYDAEMASIELAELRTY